MKHADEKQDIELMRAMMGSVTVKTDPSVKETDMYQRGEPLGSVPLERTMRKPDAYYPAKSGPK